MRSTYADTFNHDPDAAGYDADVRREDHPIRAGYQAVLAWIGRRVAPTARILDLGSGTGNTILALPAQCPVTAVDISPNMTAIARAKLRGRAVDYVVQDIVAYLDQAALPDFDTIVSTYALHHLTPDERRWVFARLHVQARPGVQILIGDLMVRNRADRARLIERYREPYPDVAADFDDEFFWNIEEATRALVEMGWNPQWTQFSELSWVVEIGRA